MSAEIVSEIKARAVPIARKGDMLDQVFRIADRLMTDGDDMVRKGMGWLLKEASKDHP